MGETVEGATLLGAVELVGPSGSVAVSRPQVQLVLTYLLLERRPVSRGEVADLLWGDRPLSPHWRGAVRGVLSKVRDLLDDAGIEGALTASADGTVRLVVPPGFATDLERARVAIDRASAALDDGDHAAAASSIAGWADRLQQPFLAAADGDWVRGAQEAVDDLARRAVLLDAQAQLGLGRPDAAAARAGAWVRNHPLDEQAHHLLIAALVADGRRPEARAAHDRLARVLADELGLGPSAATAALLGEPSSPVASQASVPAVPRHQVPSRTGSIFLGRHPEQVLLAEAWQDVRADRRPRMVLLGGPSGIGKTRLVEEFTASLDGGDRPAAVLWGRCLPESGVPFEPLTSAVLGPDAERTAVPDDPALARAHLLRSVVAEVESVAVEPTILVLDDLQWAGDDVMALLEDLIRGIEAPLLLLVTGRNLPASVHASVARLQRLVPVSTITLAGLDAVDLVPLFDEMATSEADAAELYRRTAGHPFFVSEIVVAPWRAGREIDTTEVPDEVRDWIAHRADALDRSVRARLDLASVVGVDFSVTELARCAQAPAAEVLDQLEVLVDQGFLVETDELDVFAFPHLITQETIRDRLGAARRSRLHVAVADALVAAGPAPGRHASIARHLAHAGPEHADEAARRASLAGREALDRGAWSLAETWYRTALDAQTDDPARRADALTGLGRALHHLDRGAEAEQALDEVIAIARIHGLPLAMAEAVLVLVGRAGRGAAQDLTDHEQAELLREALAAVEAVETDDRDEVVRRETLACGLEGELALALLLTPAADERLALTEHAVARARALQPPDTNLTARALITARITKLDPALLRQRISDLDQVLAISPSGRSIETTLTALTYRHEDLLRVGDRARAQAELRTAADTARRHQHPYWSWSTATWEAMDLLIDGDLDRAEIRAAEALSERGVDEAGAMACFGVNLVNLRLYQGRAGEVLDLLGQAADDHPEIPCYRAVLALCAVEAGELRQARAAFEHFRAAEFANIPDDTNRLLSLAVLADTAVQLGDERAARPLTALLQPYGDQQALLNCYGGGGAYWGPVAHQLARLAALGARPTEAAALFDQALASAESMAAPLAAARILADPVRADP